MELRLGRIWQYIVITGVEQADAGEGIRAHRHRWQQLEATEEAGAILEMRMAELADPEAIGAYATEMRDFLLESELTGTRALVRSLVKMIGVVSDRVPIRYPVPVPKDSPVKDRDAQEIALSAPVLSTVTPPQ